MAVWNLGSINEDIVYSVPHIPAAGETLAATQMRHYLGGKGANMSVALARAGAEVRHIGAIGQSSDWIVDRLSGAGVDTRHIARLPFATGHAIIVVDDAGENAITLFPGANAEIPVETVQGALSEAKTGDWFLAQNETVLQEESATLAKDLGLRVAYAAAPFSAGAARAMVPMTDLLVLNAVEAAQLEEASGQGIADLPVADVIVTRGAEGCDWVTAEGTRHFEALKVEPVDTTGAGDTFTGYLLAGLDRGASMEEAIELAQRAAALMVTRHGTSDVIPDIAEVQAFRP
ncbi:ribokinase [Histidinibacterium aquaticum]|uniref:Ribokinase n=1 Tax=Histidinibacterium aquaticum TaxID=2613962 RepID=A0A5J5GFI9_9RHOB|nr:ribokinase [Histidinibacterium aquaticum]KAA9006837.1 ribokinase [Histidinibacterium aquaticum]